MTTTQPQQPPFYGNTPPFPGQMPPFPGTTPGQSWQQVLDLWEPFIRQALEAQTAAFKSWVDGAAAAPNVPEPLKSQLQQMHELSRGWTESQRQMWESMFAMLRQIASSSQPPTPMAMPALSGMDFWQKMAAPMFEAQAAWMRQSANLVGGARGARPDQDSGHARG